MESTEPAFENRMSFGEHLEELRRRILYSLIGIVVLFVAGLCFQGDLIALIAAPHKRAMAQLEASIGLDDYRRYLGPHGWIRFMRDFRRVYRLEPRADAGRPEEREEVAKIRKALDAFFARKESASATLVATRYPEAFLTGIKAALVLALLLGAPWTIYQLWLFVSAGLYPHEKKYVGRFLPVSLLLFAAGAVFGYFILIPFGLYFLGGLGNADYVSTMITLGDYFSLFLTLTFALGLVFQLPMVMIALSLIGIVRARTYSQKRRYFVLAAFIIGAILTPPDPITQLLMAGPILVLYEVGIWGARAMERAGERSAETASG